MGKVKLHTISSEAKHAKPSTKIGCTVTTIQSHAGINGKSSHLIVSFDSTTLDDRNPRVLNSQCTVNVQSTLQSTLKTLTFYTVNVKSDGRLF